MKYFIEHPEKVKAKAVQGRNRIEQNFSANKMARETEALYNELM